jgi:hypothetical protein
MGGNLDQLLATAVRVITHPANLFGGDSAFEQ